MEVDFIASPELVCESVLRNHGGILSFKGFAKTIWHFHCLLYLILSKKYKFLEGIYSLCALPFFFSFFLCVFFIHLFLTFVRNQNCLLEAEIHIAILNDEKGHCHHGCMRGCISKQTTETTPKHIDAVFL